MTRPTLYVTAWSAVSSHGPGRLLSVEGHLPVATTKTPPARHRAATCGTGTARGDGIVPELRALDHHMRSLHGGVVPLDRVRAVYLAHRGGLRRMHVPGVLHALTPDGRRLRVEDGDTLCCSCSPIQARRGLCTRTWATELLRAAGWAVVLDGRRLEPMEKDHE